MHRNSIRHPYLISTDPSLIDLDVVHGFLSRAYWSEGIPKETVRRAIENCMVFGVYETGAEGNRQVGFGRVITDKATFAYLSDVFILEPCRGQGLSKWLVEVILGHPDLQGLRRFALLTRDAHGLYEGYGFKPIADPSWYMEIWNPEVYARAEGGGNGA